MKRNRRESLPVELWRDVNRAAYAVAQAQFSRERTHLVAVALEMLDAGRSPAQVSEAMQRREADPANPRFDY